MMTVLRAGDTLIVSELSRLARCVGQIVIIADTLRDKGTRFISIMEISN